LAVVLRDSTVERNKAGLVTGFPANFVRESLTIITLAAAACVKELISLLPGLKGVVMVGAKAVKAKPRIETKGLALFTSCHPSPIVRASLRERWEEIPTDWAKVLPLLTRAIDAGWRGQIQQRRIALNIAA
jgi:hypothetical protein